MVAVLSLRKREGYGGAWEVCESAAGDCVSLRGEEEFVGTARWCIR